MFLFSPSLRSTVYNLSISKTYNTHSCWANNRRGVRLIAWGHVEVMLRSCWDSWIVLKPNHHVLELIVVTNFKFHSSSSLPGTIFWVSVVASAALPPVPSRGGPWPSEAATTSSRRPPPVTSAGSGTCCGRCPAPWPRRTEAAPPRCTAQRTKATRRSAGCCWRRGPRSTPGLRKASRPWRDGCTVLWGDFRVQKKIEVKMWNDVKWCEM